MTSPGSLSDFAVPAKFGRVRGRLGLGQEALSEGNGSCGAGPRIGLVAGEPSGDILGAGLMAALRGRCPDATFTGIGGQRMLACGLEPVADMDRLAVNGFRDPIVRLPALVQLLRRLNRHFRTERVDALVGVDFNVFNLILERGVKRRGIPTAHYVSPSVYAWREGRTRKIGRSADVVLALYPFEPPLYERRDARAVFVGHPAADEIGPRDGSPAARRAARSALRLPQDRVVLGVLPGSRMAEVNHLAPAFLEAVVRSREIFGGDPLVAIPTVSKRVHAAIRAMAGRFPLELHLIEGQSRLVMAASDMMLVKSGTATLEAMLLRRPMVVSYRMGSVGAAIFRAMSTTKHVALPNILAGRELVPELLQETATPANLAAAIEGVWRRVHADSAYFDACGELHRQLRRGADGQAAEAVLALIGRKNQYLGGDHPPTPKI